MQQRLARTIGSDRGWVFVQLSIFVSIVAAVPIEVLLRHRLGRGSLRPWSVAAGLGLLASAAVIAGRARADLGESFTMSPTPLEDARLVDTGIYGHVRHPMYLSVLLAIAGYAALFRSWAGTVGLALTMVFLHVKTRHEERRLMSVYPTYRDYARRVPFRMLPRVL
jgi:protein-S-isoprenylcysteine O-methyltransferase Ste14